MSTLCALGAEESTIISPSSFEMTEKAAHIQEVPCCPQLDTS